eukprot:gene823-1255_t
MFSQWKKIVRPQDKVGQFAIQVQDGEWKEMKAQSDRRR